LFVQLQLQFQTGAKLCTFVVLNLFGDSRSLMSPFGPFGPFADDMGGRDYSTTAIMFSPKTQGNLVGKLTLLRLGSTHNAGFYDRFIFIFAQDLLSAKQ